MKNKNSLLTVAIAASLISILAGCSQSTPSGPSTSSNLTPHGMSAQAAQQAMATVNANKSLSASQKSEAIAQIKAHTAP